MWCNWLARGFISPLCILMNPVDLILYSSAGCVIYKSLMKRDVAWSRCELCMNKDITVCFIV